MQTRSPTTLEFCFSQSHRQLLPKLKFSDIAELVKMLQRQLELQPMHLALVIQALEPSDKQELTKMLDLHW